MNEATSTKLTRPSFAEEYDLLTWHDEQAIKAAFDVDVHDVMENFGGELFGNGDLVTATRVFEFVALRRAGEKDAAALKAVRDLTNKEIGEIAEAYLESGAEEGDDDLANDLGDEPVTESGKGGAPVE